MQTQLSPLWRLGVAHGRVGFHAKVAEAACALQVSIPLWALVHLPVVVTITTAVFTPKGWLHCILYVLFENAMGIVKLWAVIAGLPSPPLHPSSILHPSDWLPATLLAC